MSDFKKTKLSINYQDVCRFNDYLIPQITTLFTTKKSQMVIRLFLILSLLFSFGINAICQDVNLFFQKSNQFFSEVVKDGKVDYQSITDSPTKLNELTTLLTSISPESLSPKERKALLINAYNILVIKGIVNKYPTSSTQKIAGFFEKTKHNIGDHKWTLSDIENEQLRKEFKDPRIHFVLNCAAVSCPPVTNFAYLPETLNAQLDQQTRLALNNSSFIYVKNEKNYISNIFKWYKEDFTEDGSVIDFINQYRNEKLSTTAKTIHYPYDWMLNDLNPTINIVGNDSQGALIQLYTPSKLLKKGQLELQLFNNLYTQTAFRNNQRTKVNLNQRENFFTGLINVVYGASSSRRWNIGMDLNLRSVRIDDENSSPLNVLSFRNNDIQNRTALSSLGPVLKFVPFKNSKLSVKSSFLFPVVKDGESDERDIDGNSLRPWYDWNRYTWWNQFFYDKNIGDDWQLFFEADLLFRFAKPAEKYINNSPKQDLLDTPVSVFLSYFPTNKSTVYTMLQYSPRFGFNKTDTGEKVGDFHSQGDFAQTGIGFKYQVLPKIGLELSYTNFFTSSQQGAGSTFNLGIRYIN